MYGDKWLVCRTPYQNEGHFLEQTYSRNVWMGENRRYEQNKEKVVVSFLGEMGKIWEICKNWWKLQDKPVRVCVRQPDLAIERERRTSRE